MIDHVKMRASIKKTVNAIVKLFAYEKGKCTKKKQNYGWNKSQHA